MTLNSHNEHETQLVCSVNRPISAIYRVSHIKLDRVNGSKLRFVGQIRKFMKNESF